MTTTVDRIADLVERPTDPYVSRFVRAQRVPA